MPARYQSIYAEINSERSQVQVYILMFSVPPVCLFLFQYEIANLNLFPFCISQRSIYILDAILLIKNQIQPASSVYISLHYGIRLLFCFCLPDACLRQYNGIDFRNQLFRKPRSRQQRIALGGVRNLVHLIPFYNGQERNATIILFVA